MKNAVRRSFFTLIVLASFISQAAPRRASENNSAYPKWAYDAGPNPNEPMGKELIDLNARIPNFPGLSEEIMGEQKFRPVYGPVAWRMLQKPNSVKILFIGQDATHIAEAAGRPATAGFGGRAQDLAKYFGVSSSAAFINTYAFTIKGQYGGAKTPQITTQADGTETIDFRGFVDNPLWLLSQDLDSPITQWRNDLIDWILRNNRDSLKLIVLFGGAARDAAGSFVISHGGNVGTYTTDRKMRTLQIPEFRLLSAGGNNEIPVPLAADGSELFAKILGQASPKAYSETAIAKAQKILAQNLDEWKPQMVFARGGEFKNGALVPAQIGGYDMDHKLEINGERTLSLKGLALSDGTKLDHDVLVAQLPHPTRLSMMTPEEAAEAVAKDLEAFSPYVQRGWLIDADPGLENAFAAGQPYKYARATMGPEYYDFGAPASRMVAVSSASRKTKNIIIFGTRDRASFDEDLLSEMTNAKPSSLPNKNDMWTMRPRGEKSRATFDAGPGETYAKIMKENLPDRLLEAHPTNKDYGHYRGTFKNPKVVIVADPHGYDDLITARALTGTRGQYLHGLMQDLGVENEYLVVKTAPFGHDSDEDWADVLTQTRQYRKALLTQILADGTPELIVTDGPDAAAEVKKFFGRTEAPCPIVNIARSEDDNHHGDMLAAADALHAVAGFENATVNGNRVDIPRSQLTYYARIWEGTSGDRVITSNDPKFMGKAFAEVAPRWAYEQKVELNPAEKAAAKKLIKKLEDAGLRKGGEGLPEFMERMGIEPGARLDRARMGNPLVPRGPFEVYELLAS